MTVPFCSGMILRHEWGVRVLILLRSLFLIFLGHVDISGGPFHVANFHASDPPSQPPLGVLVDAAPPVARAMDVFGFSVRDFVETVPPEQAPASFKDSFQSMFGFR